VTSELYFIFKISKLTIQILTKTTKRYLKNGLFFMEFGKQKSGEERIMEQSTSETVCFAWRSRFCSFLRHKNKPSPQSFGDLFLFWAMQKRKRE
jgi:hypothetical protein